MSEAEMIKQHRWIYGKYIFFVKPDKQNPKTEVWHIFAKDGNFFLGEIRWYGPWRKYSLVIDCQFLKDKLVFEATCLTEITKFLSMLMEKRRLERKQGKKQSKLEGEVLKEGRQS